MRTAVWVVVALLVVSNLVLPAVGCVAAVFSSAGEAVSDAVDDLFADGPFADDDADDYSPSESWGEIADDADRAAAEALEARLDAALSGTGEGSAHALVAAYLDEKFLDVEGVTATDLGIDVEAWATWYLGQTSFEDAYAYAFSDGTASGYVTVSAPNANDIFWDADSAIYDYLHDEGLMSSGGMRALGEAQRAHVRELFDAVLEGAEPQEPLLQSFDLTLQNDAWVVDEQDLADSLELAFCLY